MESRPFEITNNLNPAFCCLLINTAILSFQRSSGQGLDYSLSFLILPLILHKETRDKLPRSRSTKLHVWIQQNQEVKIGFADRMNNMISYTREAILFGIQKDYIYFSDEVLLQSKQEIIKNKNQDCYLKDYYLKSSFLGRWLSDSGDRRVIFFSLGIHL